MLTNDGVQQRYAASEKKYMDENLRLTEEYKRFAESVNHQQEKHRLFQQKDALRFREVRCCGRAGR